MKKITLFGIAVLSLAIVCGYAACKNNNNYKIEVEIEMVRIPPADKPEPYTFWMGSLDSEANRSELREGPLHQVKLTGFYMSKYLITQEQYRAVTRKNPSIFQGSSVSGVENAQRLPVDSVSWYDAVEFCNRLSEAQGLTKAYQIQKNVKDQNNFNESTTDPKWTVTLVSGSTGYRLPTEAQWEYACRAGTDTPFWTGNDINTDKANYNGTPYIIGNPEGAKLNRTTVVGSYDPNEWGLYDMHGNVFELCWDWAWNDTQIPPLVYKNYYDDAFALGEPETDPTGLSSGDRRAERGGSYVYEASRSRSAFRERIRPNANMRFSEKPDVGIRLVLPLTTWP